MPLSTSKSSAPLSPLVKMEDRKRPALSATDDIAPPSKRQQTNGANAAKDDDKQEDAWIEVGPVLTTSLSHHKSDVHSSQTPHRHNGRVIMACIHLWIYRRGFGIWLS